MKKSYKIGLIIVAVVGILILIFATTYNNIMSKEEDVDGKLADISVQLERRADLIPNLINTVKGYMKHEQKVIDSITASREKLTNANTISDKASANEELNKSLNNLYLVVENYPDLKANTNFIQLQDELAGTENRIAIARRDYNEAVKIYNKTIKSFPKNIIASMFGFSKKDYFEAKESAKDVPNVSFE